MLERRVIVLHSRPSTDPNVMVGAEGAGFESLGVSTFDAASRELAELQETPRIEIKAPSFDVKLIQPLDLPDPTAAAVPPLSWGVEAVGGLNSFDH